MKGSPSVLARTGPGRGELAVSGDAECTWSFCRTCLLFSFLGQEGDFTPGLLQGRSAPVTVYATCLDSWAHRHRTGTVSKSRGTGGWTGSPSSCVQLSAGVAGNSYVNGAAGLPPQPQGHLSPAGASQHRTVGWGRGRERLYSSHWMFWGQMRKQGLGHLLRGISSPCKLLTCYRNHCGVSTIQEAGDSSCRI